MSWSVITTGPDEVHIVPKNDLFEHTMDDECACGPHTEYLEGGGKMVSHPSLDGRELKERKRKK